MVSEAARRPLRVLFCAAEVTPFAKTGGLADVAGSLPKAIRAQGHDIRVVMPRYRRISPEEYGLVELMPSLRVPMDTETEDARILEGSLGAGVPVYMVDNAKYYDRDGIYMHPDDAERFVFFCRAAVEMLARPPLNWCPDVIHCNDWHTGIIPNWMKTIYADDPFFEETATLYTIHNLAYQGVFGYRVLEIAGIEEYGFLNHTEVADLAEVVDFMARGIFFADVVSTVSETYAREILTSEFGERLDPILRDRSDRLFGILNGIDTDRLDPATDEHIAQRYDVNSLEKKTANKLALQREGGLVEDPDVPVVGMISRLTDQKGFDLVSEIIEPALIGMDFQFVLLGTGEQQYHDVFSDLARRYSDRMAVFLTFDTSLAQRIYAGSDIFLMPSRFEPCGLGQLVAMRYGGVPLVRATGGLADTVQDFDAVAGTGNGFAFREYSGAALHAALERALETYKNKSAWRELVVRDMTADYSWTASAKKYIDLYYRALTLRESQPWQSGSGEPGRAQWKERH